MNQIPKWKGAIPYSAKRQYNVNEWCGEDEDILKFARAIYEMGNDDGWESRADAEYLNSSYPTGLVGDPQ